MAKQKESAKPVSALNKKSGITTSVKAIIAEKTKALLASGRLKGKMPSLFIALMSLTALLLCIMAALAKPVLGLTGAMLYSIANDGKLSGRADGNVYMRNGRIRGMKVPALVQNQYTQRVRNGLGQLSASFRALGQDIIAAWNSATGFTYTDRFGRQHPLTGKALYLRLNQNLLSIDSTTISAPPVAEAVEGVTYLQVEPDGTTAKFNVTFDPSQVATGVRLLVSATAPLSPGITRPSRSAFRDISYIDSGSNSPQDIYLDYVGKFGSLPVGSKVFVRVIAINSSTGQASPSIIASNVVV